jgi:hypothetical protein
MQEGWLGRAIAALAAALLFGCERADPASPERVDALAEVPPAEVPPVEHEGADGVVIPPFDPSLPALRLQPAPVAGHPRKQEPPPIRPTRTAKAPSAPAPAAAAHPPLDALFRAPQPEAASSSAAVDLGPLPPDATIVPKPPGALDRLGQSIRLERRSEQIGPAGPRQGTVFETEAGVRIPVDKTVSIEGGVRVDSREEPGAKQPDRRSAPRVGVEVRF